MPDNEKTYLAYVEEVDVDGEGRVVVNEDSVQPKEVVREQVRIVYVDRYVEQPEEVAEEPAEQPAFKQADEELAATAVVMEEEPEEDVDTDEEEAVDAFGRVIRYRKSFLARLIQTQNPNQDYYTELKNELLSYKGVKSRVSWNFDSFNKGRKKCAKIAIRGKTLVIYLALDPKDEEKFPPTKYHHFDVSDVNRFAEVPFGLKVRSPRALKYAKELIAMVMAELGLVKKEIIEEDYHKPYETTEQLIKEGLIKIIGGENAEYESQLSTSGEFVEDQPKQEEQPEEVAEEPVEEPAEEAAFEAEEPAEDTVVIPVADAEVKPKYVNKSFAQKMLLADEVIQDRYDELKNYALRFKKLKARISKKFDSLNKGRLQFVKLSVAGKTLKLFLNMDIATTDPKFHCKDMRDKKTYEPVPVLLRIKSGRAVKYAKILIDQCAASHGLVENKKFTEVDAMALIEQAVAARKKN